MRTAAFVALLSVSAGISASVTGCVQRCQMGDARPECNAYGNPDKQEDAGMAAAPVDASAD